MLLSLFENVGVRNLTIFYTTMPITENPSREDWLGMDANLSVIAKAGEFGKFKWTTTVQNYYASTLYVEGSGSGVEAIFVFDEYGLNTEIIFDDPKLKNLEFDHILCPKGGQAFGEGLGPGTKPPT